MKYLILFLITFSLNAATMHYQVTNEVTGQSYGAKLEKVKGDTWRDKQLADKSWGKPARKIMEDDILDWELARSTGYTEVIVQEYEAPRDVLQCIGESECGTVDNYEERDLCYQEWQLNCPMETVTISEVPEIRKKNYDVPADYTITELDVTAEVDKLALRAERIRKGTEDTAKAQNVLKYMIGYMKDSKMSKTARKAFKKTYKSLYTALKENDLEESIELLTDLENEELAALKVELLEILE